MISDLFNSKQNKNVIKTIISEDFYKESKINIGNNHDIIINETMQFVESQVSKTTPRGMNNNEYLYLMNKKVYDIAYPVIKEITESKTLLIKDKSIKNIENNSEKNNQKKIQKNIENKNPYNDEKKKQINDNIFDPLLMRNFESPTIMDYPKPEDFKKNSAPLESKFKSLEDQRATLAPKIKPIDFNLKIEEKNNTMDKYNDLVSSINNFDNTQKNINKNIQNMEDNIMQNNDVSSFTPIDLLQNNSNILNDSSTAFNRTDIKAFNNAFNELLDETNGLESNNGIENFINFNESDENNYSLNKNNNSNNKTAIKSQSSMIPEYMNYNNDIVTQNNLDKLEFSGVNQKNNIIIEPRMKIMNNTKVLIVNSMQRDLALWPNQTQFQIKFAPNGNNYIYKSYYDEYNTLIIREKTINYAEFSDVDSYDTHDNIISIKVSSTIVPITTNNNNNIFNQSYLLLTIPELRNPYISLNKFLRDSFAKLEVDYASNVAYAGSTYTNTFTKLQISDDSEFFLYQPTTLGKLNTMTINLLNQNGVLYNFGIDKLFVQSISEGSLVYNGYCGNQYNSTRIVIQNKNIEYAKYCKLYSNYGDCSLLNSHPVQINDLLYFYNTMPIFEQIAYLEDNIKLTKITKDVNKGITIVASYKIVDENGKNKNININFNYVIPETNFSKFYIILFDKSQNEIYYLKVKSINKASILLDYIDLPNFNNYTNIKIGIGISNERGNYESNPVDPYYRSLFNISGYNVTSVNVNNDLWTIEVNYPYENLPSYLKQPEYYNAGTIFFIQSKLQVTYTFIITYNEKDSSIVNSRLNGSPGN